MRWEWLQDFKEKMWHYLYLKRGRFVQAVEDRAPLRVGEDDAPLLIVEVVKVAQAVDQWEVETFLLYCPGNQVLCYIKP